MITFKHNNASYVAGMKWIDYSKYKGGLRQIKKDNRTAATHKAVVPNKGELIGLIKLARKKNIKSYYSLAIAALPALGSHGYAVVDLGNNDFVFLASVNNRPAIVGDMVGNVEKMKQVLSQFLKFNDAPETGWKVLSEPENPVEPEAILPAKPAKIALVEPLYNRKPLVAGLAVLALLWAGNYGYHWWQAEQERVAVQKAIKESQERIRKAEELRSALNPWSRDIPATAFLSLCRQARYNIPVSIAGWRLVGGRCLSNSNGVKGKPDSGPVLELGFAATDGRTAEEFRNRAWYYLHQYPHFNLLEGGDTGTVSISLTKNESQMKGLMKNEDLPELSSQLMRIVTHFQNKSQKVTFSEVHAPAPWHTVNFAMHSRQAPEVLMQDLNDQGIRISSVVFSLSQKGELEYDVKGTIYASR